MSDPQLSPFGVWVAQHVALLGQLAAGGGALAVAWRAAARHGGAAAVAALHAAIGHDTPRFDAAVFGALERDSRGSEPRLYPINNRVHARDIRDRTDAVAQACAATEALDRKVEALGAVIDGGFDRSREATDRLTETMGQTNEALGALRSTLEQHGREQAATTAKLELMEKRWTGPEQRAGPDPKRPRTRGGRRRTDPA